MMMTRTERAEVVREKMVADRTKSAMFDTEIPQLVRSNFSVTGNDYAKGRTIVGAIAPVLNMLEPKIYAAGLITQPGDPVKANAGAEYTYVYSGSTPMTHANPTFGPGAAGVYYWAIIPKVKDGIKIFPSVAGIIVAVTKDELWYDPTGKTVYRWNADSWSECSSNYFPGAAGVHQWVKS